MKGKSLKIKVFHIDNVTLADKFDINTQTKTLSITKDFHFESDYLDHAVITLLPPEQHQLECNTMMDVLPISTKVLGELGSGITHTLTGVKVIMSGAIDEGEQLHEFGSSEGLLTDHLKYGKPGTPLESDYIIHVDFIIKKGTPFNRLVCLDCFKMMDHYIQQIREQMKMLNGNQADEVHEYEERYHTGKPKVALVKEVAGQGAMYDMQLFSHEPSGFHGGISIIDMNNMPVLLSPNEYRDGAIRAMV